jgi:hypothetical protein
MPHHPWAVEVTRASLQSWLYDSFDAFCYVPFVDHDYALHTPDEFCDNHVDIDKQDIYCAIPSDLPDFYHDIYCSDYIVCFSRYAFWLVGTPLRSNTSDSLSGDCVEPICHNTGR